MQCHLRFFFCLSMIISNVFDANVLRPFRVASAQVKRVSFDIIWFCIQNNNNQIHNLRCVDCNIYVQLMLILCYIIYDGEPSIRRAQIWPLNDIMFCMYGQIQIYIWRNNKIHITIELGQKPICILLGYSLTLKMLQCTILYIFYTGISMLPYICSVVARFDASNIFRFKIDKIMLYYRHKIHTTCSSCSVESRMCRRLEFVYAMYPAPHRYV